MIKPGDKAPNFAIHTDVSSVEDLNTILKSSHVVLYFYPRDNTPGCTKQACSFESNIQKIEKFGAKVIGVSPDTVESHAKFRGKFDLSFPLHSDPSHEVCELYGVWGEKKNYGKTYFGVIRSTFLIKKGGKIAEIWNKVKVAGHEDVVIEALKKL
ncbi:MAG: thioredoxin-dependent thiol peroxidase [Proteobacteria bacterium]|nr:thioredoxin-dependent thiol peroxidase [Pseudomonadota bacterium]